MFHLPRSTRATLAALVALVAAACAESPVGAPSETALANVPAAKQLLTSTTWSSGTLWNDGEQWNRAVWVCKVGTSATFSVAVNNGTPFTVSLAPDECKRVWYYAPDWNWDESDPAWAGADTVQVTEVFRPTLVVLDSIVKDSTRNYEIHRLPTLTGVETAQVITTRSKGGILTFFNRELPPAFGGQGCTPGYWKVPQHHDSWTPPYAPNSTFASVFGSNVFGNMTLLQVLKQGGGDVNALGRHSVAALLNAASADVNYDIATPAMVIAAFNAAVANGTVEAQHQIFANFNEQGCPLN